MPCIRTVFSYLQTYIYRYIYDGCLMNKNSSFRSRALSALQIEQSVTFKHNKFCFIKFWFNLLIIDFVIKKKKQILTLDTRSHKFSKIRLACIRETSFILGLRLYFFKIHIVRPSQRLAVYDAWHTNRDISLPYTATTITRLAIRRFPISFPPRRPTRRTCRRRREGG